MRNFSTHFSLIVFSIVLLLLFHPVLAQEEASQQQTTQKKTSSEKPEELQIRPEKSGNPIVVLETNYGNIAVELFKKEAPKSVDNFLRYVNEGFYDDTIFHRVVKGFVIQAGGMTKDLVQKKQHDPIENEATNGLKNKRGTLSMARTSAINSATSHFFINLVDNPRLDHTGIDPSSYGYAVFGKVIKGMDVVDAIAEVKVTNKGNYQNVPVNPVVIKKAYVLKQKKASDEKTGQLKKEEKQIGEEEEGSKKEDTQEGKENK
ncbi:MAG: peptidylprolyl isomerase [bacterium]